MSVLRSSGTSVLRCLTTVALRLARLVRRWPTSAAATIFALSVVPAHADWTDAERASLVEAHQASANLTAGVSYYINQLIEGTTRATWSPLSNALYQHEKALMAVTQGNARLLNVGDTSAFTGAPPLGQRAQTVQLAWQQYDRAIEFIGYTLEAVSAIPCNGDAGCLNNVRVWTQGLGWARQKLQAIDRTLAYANPYPTNYPTIIGPHGDYDPAQWGIWRAAIYAHIALEDMQTAYGTLFLTDGYAELGRAPSDLLNVLYVLNHQAMRLGGAVRNDDSALVPAEDFPFFRVLDILRVLTTSDQGLAMSYAWFLEFDHHTWWLRTGRNKAFDAAVEHAKVSMSDSWQREQMASWQFMVFKNCSILKNPAGCGGTGPR